MGAGRATSNRYVIILFKRLHRASKLDSVVACRSRTINHRLVRVQAPSINRHMTDTPGCLHLVRHTVLHRLKYSQRTHLLA